MTGEYRVEVVFTFWAEDGSEPTREDIYSHLMLAITDPHKVDTHAPAAHTETTHDLLAVTITPL